MAVLAMSGACFAIHRAAENLGIRAGGEWNSCLAPLAARNSRFATTNWYWTNGSRRSAAEKASAKNPEGGRI